MTDNSRGKAPTTSPSVTASSSAAVAAHSDPRIARRARWASLVGTSLESYDFYIYAYFAAFFVGPLFFDPLGGFGGTLAAFLSIALAFVACGAPVHAYCSARQQAKARQDLLARRDGQQQQR